MDNEMRKVVAHLDEADKASSAMEIVAHGKPGPSGANNVYAIHGFSPKNNPSYTASTAGVGMTIYFQNGPVSQKGPNGTTMEALLAVVADRLNGFQNGTFPCEENAEALEHLNKAIAALQRRSLRIVTTPAAE
jgi:hypothetical protein